jgi:FixJ family two-component response regulator
MHSGCIIGTNVILLRNSLQEQYSHIVYVLDPDEAVRDSLRILLDSFDIQVKAYTDAETFMQEAAGDGGACALIENRLPDIDGLSMVSRLREMGSGMPVLLLTSTQDDRLARRALEKGFAGVIHKPLLNDRLLRQLALLLRPTPPGLIDLRP